MGCLTCQLTSQSCVCGLQHPLTFTLAEGLTVLCTQLAVYRCLLDIAAGMDYLHSLGVLHGTFPGPPGASCMT